MTESHRQDGVAGPLRSRSAGSSALDEIRPARKPLTVRPKLFDLGPRMLQFDRELRLVNVWAVGYKRIQRDAHTGGYLYADIPEPL
jgi:hypothetical protein